MVRKRGAEPQIEVDGGDMPEFSASGSDADGNTAVPSVQTVEHEEVYHHEPSKDMVGVQILPGRFDDEFNDKPEVPESRYVSKIVDPITGQPWTSASGPLVTVNRRLWKNIQDQERQWWENGVRVIPIKGSTNSLIQLVTPDVNKAIEKAKYQLQQHKEEDAIIFYSKVIRNLLNSRDGPSPAKDHGTPSLQVRWLLAHGGIAITAYNQGLESTWW